MIELYARHVSAEGKEGSALRWRYDDVRKTVVLTHPRGIENVDVCSMAEPRFGAHPIARINETTWKVLPVRFKGLDLTAEQAPVIENYGNAFVLLLDAPDNVAHQLEEIA